MQIGDLSARTGATVRMLRYYEEQGLLEPQRTEAGYRIYEESDVLRVGHIRCMLASALPSDVVRQALRFLLDERPPIPEHPADRAELAAVLRSELDALTERIEILNRSREQLARFADDVARAVVGPAQPLPAGESPPTEFGPAVRQGAPLPKRTIKSSA